MQRGGGGGGIVVGLARRAAASARSERAARLASLRPAAARRYRGVHRRRNRYCAVIWVVHAARLLWLGSYETPEEAAYAYDAAARLTRGYRAMPSFPAPAWWARAAAAAPAVVVSTDLVLALPTPAHRDLAEAVAGQVSFDNWLLQSSALPPGAAAQPQPQQPPPPPPPPQQQSTPPAAVLPQQQRLLPPFTQFFHLASDPAIAAPNANATATATATAAAAVANPSIPGAFVLTPKNVQVPSTTTKPASSGALSSTDPVVHASSQLLSAAAAPTQRRHRDLPPGVSDDLAVVADNFPEFDRASSSAARPPVPPRLTIKDLLLQLQLQFNLPGGRGGYGGAL